MAEFIEEELGPDDPMFQRRPTVSWSGMGHDAVPTSKPPEGILSNDPPALPGGFSAAGDSEANSGIPRVAFPRSEPKGAYSAEAEQRQHDFEMKCLRGEGLKVGTYPAPKSR